MAPHDTEPDRALEAEFHDAMLERYQTWKTEFGYRATRFLQKVRADGGLRAAKAWLLPRKGQGGPTKGFKVLNEHNRLDVSVEALVVQKPWSALFTEAELSVARKRLSEHGFDADSI